MEANPPNREVSRPGIDDLDLKVVNKGAWPLLAAFVLLGFFDMLTTLIAYQALDGFVEFNAFAANLFKMGLFGFVLAEFTKCLPIFPLAYMVTLRRSGTHTDNQVGLLKLTAFIVLLVADIFLALIVVANNLPNLLGIGF